MNKKTIGREEKITYYYLLEVKVGRVQLGFQKEKEQKEEGEKGGGRIVMAQRGGKSF